MAEAIRAEYSWPRAQARILRDISAYNIDDFCRNIAGLFAADSSAVFTSPTLASFAALFLFLSPRITIERREANKTLGAGAVDERSCNAK